MCQEQSGGKCSLQIEKMIHIIYLIFYERSGIPADSFRTQNQSKNENTGYGGNCIC
jgi:hypothetical protein